MNRKKKNVLQIPFEDIDYIVGLPSVVLQANAVAYARSSDFNEQLYCVLFAKIFCHSGLAAVPRKKFVKVCLAGGGAHGVWLRMLVPQRAMP